MNGSLRSIWILSISSTLIIKIAGQCEDSDPFCNFWREEGECSRDPGYMNKICPLACGNCRGENREVFVGQGVVWEGEAVDSSPHCCYWALKGQCDANPYWMRPNCQHSCGTHGCTVVNATKCLVRVTVSDCPWRDYKPPSNVPRKPRVDPSNPSSPSAPILVALTCDLETKETVQNYFKENEKEIRELVRAVDGLANAGKSLEDRMVLAQKTVAKINQHNKNPGSYCQGISKFSFLTNEELMLMKGYETSPTKPPSRKESNNEEVQSKPTPIPPLVTRRQHKKLPALKKYLRRKYSFSKKQRDDDGGSRSVPLFSDWSGYTGPVGDQRACRNSWAFVAAQNLGAIEIIERNRLQSYSVEQLTNCALKDRSENGCRGKGNPLDGWNYWTSYQPLTERQLRMTGRYAPIQNGGPPGSWGRNWGERGYFRLRRGINACGIASDISFPVLAPDDSSQTPFPNFTFPPSHKPAQGTGTSKPPVGRTEPGRTRKPSTKTRTKRTTTTMMLYPTTPDDYDYPDYSLSPPDGNPSETFTTPPPRATTSNGFPGGERETTEAIGSTTENYDYYDNINPFDPSNG